MEETLASITAQIERLQSDLKDETKIVEEQEQIEKDLRSTIKEHVEEKAQLEKEVIALQSKQDDLVEQLQTKTERVKSLDEMVQEYRNDW